MRPFLLGAIASVLVLAWSPASGQTGEGGGARSLLPGSLVPSSASGRLLLTGGVTMFE